MATIQELRALALQIRDADEDRENTALKVGQFLYDLLGYLDTKADLTTKGQWSKQLSFNQTPIVALQSVEAIPDTQGQNNKMWWSSDDGQLKWKANDEVYPLGNPTYILYYCGNKIYRWSGSSTGFVEMAQEFVNNLFTLSADKGTSAGVAVVIRNNVDILQAKVDALIDALAPLAFVGQGVAKAGLLDWSGNGVFFVTVGYNLTGVTATDNTDADSHIVVGGNLVVTLTTLQYYTLTGATFEVKDDKNNSVAYTLNGNTLTINNLTRSVTIKVVGVLSGAHLVTIPTVEHLTFKDGDDNEVSGELIVPDGDPLELTLVPDKLWGIESCAVEMGGDEVIDAYSWEFDENWNRVHTISIEEVTGDVGISAIMEDWNVAYNYVNVITSGRILWNFAPSYITPIFPIVNNHLIRVTFGSADKIHAASFFNEAGAATSLLSVWRNTTDPLSGNDIITEGSWARISYQNTSHYGSTKMEDLTSGKTLWNGATSSVTPKGNEVFVERFLPSVIMSDGYDKTDVQEQTSDPDYSGNGVTWAYRYKRWAPAGSACSFIFSLPQVQQLTIYCGSGGGMLYVYYTGSSPWTRSSYAIGTSETTLNSISTSYMRGFLYCAGGKDDLHNSYVKYGGKYVWWGSNVHPQQSEIWEGAGVVQLPSFVEDVWTQNNE